MCVQTFFDVEMPKTFQSCYFQQNSLAYLKNSLFFKESPTPCKNAKMFGIFFKKICVVPLTSWQLNG